VSLDSPVFWGLLAFATALLAWAGSGRAGRGAEPPAPDGTGHTPADQPPAAPRPAGPERRQHLRRAGLPVEVVVADFSCGSKPRGATVVNRSEGGLLLWCDRRAFPGQLLRVRAPGLPEESPWVWVRVVRCRESGRDRWEAGCQFVEDLPWSVLLRFG
jgi:hypothetical protein